AAAPDAAAGAWRSTPAQGVEVRGGEPLVVETGPHAVLWHQGEAELAPPYTLRATLTKRSGRLHEGFGLVFGASGLDGPEANQVYSYFLVRGDGSFLVKRRQGAETPVVRDWTTHPAIRRDGEDGGRPAALEVRVEEGETAFLVNGEEVARVPSADLSVRGRVGLRVAHDLRLEVAEFAATPGGASAAPAGAAPPADSAPR
ncbi:MAG TPA: hypothetical protein VHG91_04835, partial [Longimicrobium sp.]|nr:hypothetical protein [Longimicrobium sp.]